MGFFRYARRLPASFTVAVVTIILVGAPRPAEAQTVAIGQTGITRDAPLRSDPVSRYKVSRSDCLANDVIHFPVGVSNFAGSTLEVWATQSTSDDCRTDTARTTASATCWRVYSAVPNSVTLTVSIRVQDFAARPATTDGIGQGTAASCESTSTTGQPLTLWFMFLQGTSQVGTAQSWPTTVDMLAPSPPTENQLGAGNKLLKMTWTPNTDPDVTGYKLFCENLGSTSTGGVTTYEAGAPGPDKGTTCPDAGTGTTDDAGDDASDEAGGAATDATCTPTPGTGDGSTGGTSGCGSLLVEGQTLTPDQIAQFSCAEATGHIASSATITGLTNFERYAVAVASRDLVENVGAISSVQCDTPQPVKGFDEEYRIAGGTAGGASFCSLGPRSAAARAKLWPAAAFAAVVVFGKRRRRLRRTIGLRHPT